MYAFFALAATVITTTFVNLFTVSEGLTWN
jgi:hypothetical protein